MKKISATLLSFVLPALVYAGQGGDFDILLGDITVILKQLIYVAMAMALLFFFWGLAKFILHADSESEHKKGKQLMLWGIIALFVMVSLWGIISFVRGELPLTNDSLPQFDETTRPFNN